MSIPGVLQGPAAAGMADTSAIAPIVRAIIESLDALAGYLRELDDESYDRKPAGLEHGTIGGHVRHTLDHVTALIGALEDGELDYDSRKRGTSIEVDCRSALEEIAAVRRSLERLGSAHDRPLELRAVIFAGGPDAFCRTSLSRELVFVLSHTIHHQAMIAALARSLGLAVPARFGYAPSTLAHLDGVPPAHGKPE